MSIDFNLLHGLSKYRSQLMGVAIIWIMLFHSGIDAPDNFVLRVIWYIFVSFGGGCGVDLFFMLSGYGLVYSASKLSSSREWIPWIGKRLKRIVPSYLIVAVMYYMLCDQLSWYNLLQLNFLLDGVRDFLFIPAIIICYLFFPLVFGSCKKYGFRICCTVYVLLVLLGSVVLVHYLPDYFCKTEIFLLRIPCFIIGVYCGFLSKNNLLREYGYFIAASFCLTALCFLISFPGDGRWCFTFGSVLIVQFIILLYSILMRGDCLLSEFCGKRSLQIYLVHVSIGGLIASHIPSFPLSMVVYFAGSIVIAVVIYKLTEVFFN